MPDTVEKMEDIVARALETGEHFETCWGPDAISLFSWGFDPFPMGRTRCLRVGNDVDDRINYIDIVVELIGCPRYGIGNVLATIKTVGGWLWSSTGHQSIWVMGAYNPDTQKGIFVPSRERTYDFMFLDVYRDLAEAEASTK